MPNKNSIELVVESKDKTKLVDLTRKIKRLSDEFRRAGKDAGQELAKGLEQGAKKAASKVEDQGKKAADGLAKNVKQGSKKAADDIADAGKDGGRKFAQNIKEFAKHAADEFKQVANRAKEMAGEMGEKVKAGGSKMKGAGLALGALLAGGLLAAVAVVGTKLVAAMNIDAANDKLTAQLNLSTEAAKKAGQAAANVYASNWGTSIEDVNGAIKTIGTNMLNVNTTSRKELEATTTRALALRDAFEIDIADSTRAVAQLMRTGLAKNAKEAFDIITAGMQQGLDKEGDWIDTINEYSTQFRKLGIDGEYAMSLISAGMRAGARDADIVADAIKEFSIRSIDGSKLTGEGFKAAGLNADKMSAAVAKGGPAAKKAFQQTLDAVNSIRDPIKREAAGVALFGTQWEDMGPKVAAAMGTASEGVDDLAGSTDKLANTMGDNLAGKIESLKRAGEVWANSKLLPFVEEMSDRFTSDFAPALDSIKQAFAFLVPIAREFGEKILATLKDNVAGIADAFRDNKPQLEAFASALAGLAPVIGTVLIASMRAAGLAIEYMIRGIGFAVDAFLFLKENIARTMAAGLEVWQGFVAGVFVAVGMLLESFRGYARAADKVFGTNTEQALDGAIRSFKVYSQHVNRELEGSINKLYETANAAKSERALIKLKANKQDVENKIADVKRRLRDPKLTNPQRSKLRADASRLRADLIAAQAAINRLRGKTVTLRTNREIYTYRYDSTKARRGSQPGMAHGGIAGAGHAAEGGPRNNLTAVGENGIELLDLPPGTMVHSNPDSQRMLSQTGKASGDIYVTVMVGTERLGQLLIRPLRNEVVALGGNVQAVLGKGA
jgi:phage-related minor tail protein